GAPAGGRPVKALVAGTALLLAACGGTGKIAGSVNEVEAGPLANVQITIDGLKTHEQLKTDANGRFELPTLPPGPYTLKAESSEYVSDTKQVAVARGGTATANFVLHPACLEAGSYVDGGLAGGPQAAQAIGRYRPIAGPIFMIPVLDGKVVWDRTDAPNIRMGDPVSKAMAGLFALLPSTRRR